MTTIDTTERLLKLDQVKEIVQFGHNKIYSMIKSGEFPPPRKFGSSSRWRYSEIYLFMIEQWPPTEQDQHQAQAAA